MPQENLNIGFEKIFKEVIIPFFKARGFKRKGNHFALQINDITQVFNVQKSKWNSYHDDLSFTFNLGFYNEIVFKESRVRNEKIDFPQYYDCPIRFRLGNISHNRDHWYKLSPNIPFEKVKKEVECDLEKYASEIFGNYQNLSSWSNLIGKYEWLNNMIDPYNLISILWNLDRKEEAKKLLHTSYKQAYTPQTVESIISHPDGRKEEKISKPYINQSYIDNIERLAKLYNVPLNKEKYL